MIWRMMMSENFGHLLFAATPAMVLIVLLVLTGSPAFAQAGSAGGTLGKTDKSVSGGGDSAPSAKPSGGDARSRAIPPPQTGTASMAGRWDWTADCQSGHYTAGFQITQGMSGEINGSLFGDPVNGSITGHVGNGTISFTRSAWLLTQHWIGQIGEGGRQIVNGSITGNENCTWRASKE